jgi:GntR family transcriptional regulator
MFVRVQTASGIPVYEQIARQIKHAIAEGALAQGDFAPSVRDLARELAVNPNTVSRAYLELKRDGMLETLPGAGMAVCSGARRKCQSQRRQLVAASLRAALDDALRAGLDAAAITELVGAHLSRVELQSLVSGDDR